MSDFNIEKAFEYYNNHINRQDRFRLLRERGFPIPGSVHPVDWELFGSILTGELGKSGYGSDLSHYEIKSASGYGSFEYQYHLHGGEKKLLEDMEIDHLFISYSSNYSDVFVRLIVGNILKPIFQEWRPQLIANYQGANRKQRFRKSIPYGFVAREGILIMKIENYQLSFPRKDLYE